MKAYSTRIFARLAIFLTVFTLGWSLSASAKGENTLNSLRGKVATAQTASDSIKALYNLFDALSDNIGTVEDRDGERIAALNAILTTSLATNDYRVAMDAIRNLSSIYGHDAEKQRELIEIARGLPVSDEQKETITFIRMTRNSSGAAVISSRPIKVRTESLKEAIKDYQHSIDSRNLSTYTQIENLFNLVAYGASMLQAEDISDYLDQLDSLVMKTRSADAAISNIFYSNAAQLYTQIGETEKAIEADKRMLAIIDRLEERAKESGRVYKNYDLNRFMSYRRMLSNYEALSGAEEDELYHKILEIVKKRQHSPLPEHRVDYARAMYAMAKENYPEAVRLFRKMIAAFPLYKGRPTLVKRYMVAAEKSGNHSALIEAQKYCIDVLQDQGQVALDNEYGRLAIQFNLDAIKMKNRQLEDRNKMLDAEATHNATVEAHRRTVLVMSTIGVALGIILLVVIFSFRRQRKLNHQMRKVNERLRSERDTMHRTQAELTQARDRARAADRQKSEFIHSISHEIAEPVKAIVGYTQLVVDSIEGPRRQYLNRFIEIIDANTLILQRLVNDVLDAAELDNSQTTVTIQNVSIKSTLELLSDIYAPKLSENLQLIVEPVKIISDNASDSGTIDTDPQRLEQILNNLLNNAVKFTEKGTITVSSTIDRPANKLTISVTDTGPGIPEGKEEKCFDRFEKLGRYTQGAGLGLHVSRLLARLLGGDIVIDASYKNGARFVLTIPVRPSQRP